MTNFAVLNGNIVSNIIVCDSKELAEKITNSVCIEYDSSCPAYAGYIYNYETNEFVKPVIKEPTE